MKPFCCPKCGDADHIDIAAMLWVRLVQNGEDEYETDADRADEQDHEWGSRSLAVCRDCGYSGRLARFEVHAPEPCPVDTPER